MSSRWLLLGLAVAILAMVEVARGQTAARQAGYLYLSPVPGAPYVSEQTRYVLLRFETVTPSQVTNLASCITVTGATSGRHAGTTQVASDGRTVRFEMTASFNTNELVNVALSPEVAPGAGGRPAPFQYQFMVTAPLPGTSASPAKPLKRAANAERQFKAMKPWAQMSIAGMPPLHRPKALLMTNGVSVPGDFPQVIINVSSNPSPGYLFLEHAPQAGTPYTMILDNSGLPVWYRRGFVYDFKEQPDGTITWTLGDGAGFSVFDQNFNFLRTYCTTNGYLTDGHECKVLADGSYFLLGYRTNTVDMSRYVTGGAPGASVRETVLQEFTAAGELVFQWRPWDHYNIADENGNTDFPHFNGIDIDDDGNVLVSARHLSEVTKIDRDSGDIVWRLSGAHSSFAFVNDPFNGTSFQHNISALGQGRYMVFDNGNYHVPQVSRAVEYQLDLTHWTATLVWQFRDAPDAYTYFMGNAQRLPTGNTLVDFVLPQYPKAIEVDASGVTRFELSTVPASYSYRAFRFPWRGAVAAPYLVVEPQLDNVTLIFNKFGDTNVAYYRIYEGPAPQPTNVVAESTSTLTRLSRLTNGLAFFRVTAVNREGVESPFSNEESTLVNIVPPGSNLVQNGDFSQGGAGWALNLSSIAIAVWSVESNLAQFYITNGAESLTNVQLAQAGIPLLQGSQYVLEFDGWSSQSRYIDVKLAQGNAPFIDYSQIAPPYLTPNRTHFHYAFTMQQPSDLSAGLLFNLGAWPGTVYLENIAVFNPPLGDLNQDGHVDPLDLSILAGQWLHQQPGLPGDLDGDGNVNFTDFGVLGENWSPAGP